MKYFKIRYAFKNIKANTLRLVSIILCITISISIAIILFSAKDVFFNMERKRLENYYGDFDIKMEVDVTNSVPYFSVAPISNLESVTKSLYLFKGYAIYDNGEDVLSVNAYGSSITELKKIVDIDIKSLGDNEIIVTRSFYENYINKDTIDLYLKDESISFKIVNIIDDCSFLTGNTVFVNKSSITNKYLSSTQQLMSNFLFNTCYLKVSDGKEAQTIQNLNEIYQNGVDITLCYSDEIIASNVNNSMSYLFIIAIFLCATILMVLNSLLKRIFSEKNHDYGVIISLGGNDSYHYNIMILELVFYFLLAIPLGILLSVILINIIISYMKIGINYQIDGLSLFKGIFSIVLIVSFIYSINILLMRKKTIKKLINHNSIRNNGYMYDCTLALILIGLIAIDIYVIGRINITVKSILLIILVLLLIFTLITPTIKIVRMVIKKLKIKSIFSIFNLKYIEKNKIYHTAMVTLMISTIAIIFTTVIKNYSKTEIDLLRNAISFNYVYYGENKIDFLSDMEKTDSYIVSNLKIMKKKIDNIDFTFSMNYDLYYDYFDFEIDFETFAKLKNNDHYYIALPSNYQYVYKLNVDDEITILANNSTYNMKIAGFVDEGFGNFAFTNLYYYKESNSKLIKLDKTYENKKNIYNLVDVNNQVYDIDLIVANYFGETKNVIDLVYIFSLCIVFILVIVIINNQTMFYVEMKKEYTKLRILGLSKKEMTMNMALEGLVVYLIISFFSVIAVLILTNELSNVMLIFNLYYKVRSNPYDVFVGLLIGFLAFQISQGYLTYKVTSTKLVEDIQ